MVTKIKYKIYKLNKKLKEEILEKDLEYGEAYRKGLVLSRELNGSVIIAPMDVKTTQEVR